MQSFCHTLFLCVFCLSCCSNASVSKTTLVHGLPFLIAILNGTCIFCEILFFFSSYLFCLLVFYVSSVFFFVEVFSVNMFFFANIQARVGNNLVHFISVTSDNNDPVCAGQFINVCLTVQCLPDSSSMFAQLLSSLAKFKSLS